MMRKLGNVRILMIVSLFIYLLALPLVAGASSHNQEVGLTIEKTFYAQGEEILVKFHAPAYWPEDAWIGIIPSQIQHGSEEINDAYDITYQYIEKRTHGVMVFTAPEPGQWDLRMHNTDRTGKEISYVSFTVR